MTAGHNPGQGAKGDIKACESRLGATRSPRFPTLAGRPRRPTLPFLQWWTQFGLSPHRVAWRSPRAQRMGVFIGLPVDGMWNARFDLQAGADIYHWGYLRSWLILSSQNDPRLGPQFQPPVWSVGGPISLCPRKARTYFQVPHLDMDHRSGLLSSEQWGLPWLSGPPVGMTPIVVILAS